MASSTLAKPTALGRLIVAPSNNNARLRGRAGSSDFGERSAARRSSPALIAPCSTIPVGLSATAKRRNELDQQSGDWQQSVSCTHSGIAGHSLKPPFSGLGPG